MSSPPAKTDALASAGRPLVFIQKVRYAVYMGRIVVLALVPLLISIAIVGKVLTLGPFSEKFICANSISCIKDLSGKFDDNAVNGIFMARNIKVPQLLAQTGEKAVLGQTTGGNKHIFVDLGKQILYAYEDQKLALSFPVATGKWGPTPTGDFKIWVKLRYTRMTGGEGADFYDLPNVPYVMFYYNNEVSQARGYSLHGAYWHNNFGHPMSHGCVNIKTENAEKLFYWANPPTSGSLTYATADSPGTLITIYGTPPQE